MTCRLHESGSLRFRVGSFVGHRGRASSHVTTSHDVVGRVRGGVDRTPLGIALAVLACDGALSGDGAVSEVLPRVRCHSGLQPLLDRDLLVADSGVRGAAALAATE